MPPRLPPLNAVRAFEAAGRHLSLTRAAQELFVTHGAVSRQVQALEDWLGVRLFHRRHRQLELTDAGRSYLAEVGPALERLGEATSRLTARARARPLTVDASSSFTLLWLMPRLADFQLAHPEVELRLVQSRAPMTGAQLGDGVAVRNGPEEWPGLVAQRFLKSGCSPVCSPALLRRARLKSPADLARQTLLHARSAPASWPDWLEAAGQPRLRPAAELHFDHLYFALQAAQDGLGVAMGPLPMVRDALATGRLVMPFPHLAPEAPAFYVLRAARPAPGPEVVAFCDWLQAQGR